MLGELEVDGDGGGGARGGATGECGTCPAFPDAEAEGVGLGCEEADVDLLREVGVCGESGSDGVEADVGVYENGMGVPDGGGEELELLALANDDAALGRCDGSEVDLDVGGVVVRVERNGAGLGAGVGGDSEVEGGWVGGGGGSDVEGYAAEAVAAHLGTGAVGVEDDHLGVFGGVWGDEEDAVGADAEVAVADGLNELRGEGLGGALDEDEVVAESVVLGEGDGHGRDGCKAGSRAGQVGCGVRKVGVG